MVSGDIAKSNILPDGAVLLLLWDEQRWISSYLSVLYNLEGIAEGRRAGKLAEGNGNHVTVS